MKEKLLRASLMLLILAIALRLLFGPEYDARHKKCIGHCRQDHECQKRCSDSPDGCPHWDDEE